MSSFLPIVYIVYTNCLCPFNFATFVILQFTQKPRAPSRFYATMCIQPYAFHVLELSGRSSYGTHKKDERGHPGADYGWFCSDHFVRAGAPGAKLKSDYVSRLRFRPLFILNIWVKLALNTLSKLTFAML